MTIRPSAAGASAALAVVCLSLGGMALFHRSDTAFGPLARMLDSVAPHLFVISFVFACLVVACGQRRLGAFLAVAALGAIVALYANLRTLQTPTRQGDEPTIRILFYNLNAANQDNSDRILSAALDRDADVLVFTEAKAISAHVGRLASDYSFVSPCAPDTCQILIATNLDVLRFWQLQLNPIWEDRYAVIELVGPSGDPFFLTAVHLVKPWFSGVAEGEIGRLGAQYNWLEGPSVSLGDFNMAPWSLPMRNLMKDTGFRAVRGQPASWPVFAGRFGIPIDQILMRDGPRVQRISTFGKGLGSNHLGFVADVHLPDLPSGE